MIKNFLIFLTVTAILMTSCEQEESIQNENQSPLTTTSLSSISPQYANLEFDSLYQIYQEDPFSFLSKVSGGKICYTTNDHNQRLRQKFLDMLTEFSVSEYDFINEAGFPNFTSEFFVRDGALTHYIVPVFDISSFKVVTYFHFIEENDEIIQMKTVNTGLSIDQNVYLFLNYLMEKSFCQNNTALKGSFGKERGCAVEIWEITLTEWTAYLASNTLGNTEEYIIANSYSTLLPLLECDFSPSGGGGGTSGSNNGGYGNNENNINKHTKNFELCQELYGERIALANMTDEELNLFKHKVELCGCSTAINNNSNSNTFGFQFIFRNCLVCDNSEATLLANDFFNNLRLPCVGPDEKTEIMKQLAPPCNSTNFSNFNLKDIMQKLNELKIPYVSKVTTNQYNPTTTNILVTNTALLKYADTQDLSDEELCVYLQYPCLREQAGGKSVLQMISDLQSQTIMDPCDPDKSTKDIIKAVVENMCNGDYGELTEEIFLQNWDAVDKINEDPSFANCKKIKCIYNQIYDMKNDLFCSTIGNFEYITTSDLVFQVGTNQTNLGSSYFEANPTTRGVTTINSKGQIVIAFNPILCDAIHPMDIAQTILHEGIHANIYKYLKDNWIGDWPEFTSSSYTENFGKLFELCCNPSDPSQLQHQLMLETWIDELAKGLWEFNNKYGQWEDYKYKALQGVYNPKDPCSNNVLSEYNFELYKSQYKNNIVEQVTFDSCD